MVLGAPGIGKTNLTVAALNHANVAARYGRRRVFVHCEGSASAASTVIELAKTLGMPLTVGNVRASCIQHLGSARSLVCLDNAETPWEADTHNSEVLFAELAGVAGLVISMRGVERPGGLEWAPTLQLQALDRKAASALFLSIAPPGFNSPGLAELLDEMGGVPLAIELLAYAADGEGLESLSRRWRAEKVALLRRGDADDRLLSVAISLESSWSGPLMTEPARRLLSILGRLPDGLAHSDVDGLMPGDGAAAASVMRRRGMAFDVGGRLRLHPPIRHYIETAHPPSAPDWQRAIAYYQHLSVELGTRVGNVGAVEAVDRLAAETANLKGVLLSSENGVGAVNALDAVHSLRDLARFTAIDIGILFQKALRLAEATQDDKLKARAHMDLADISLDRGDHEGARPSYEAALPLCRQLNDVRGEAHCIKCLGDIEMRRSDDKGAQAHYEEALSLFHQLGAAQGEANCIRSLGDIALARSDNEGAQLRYEQALPMYRDVGSKLGEANCIMRLGEIALGRSDHGAAQRQYEEALPLHRSVGNMLGEATCILGLGDIALARLDKVGARRRYQQALALYQQIADPRLIGLARERLARL